MNRKPDRPGAFVVLGLLTLLVIGCNKKLSLSPVFNERPTIRLSAAPVDTLGPDGKRATYIYHYKMNWVGYDPDGRVIYFLYTIDPPGSPGDGEKGRDPAQWADTTLTRVVINDTTYCKTTLYEKEIFFSSGKPDEPIQRADPHAADIHTFVIKAVDNSGTPSAPRSRTLTSVFTCRASSSSSSVSTSPARTSPISRSRCCASPTPAPGSPSSPRS